MKGVAITKKIIVKAKIAAPIQEVWRAWNTPDDINKWNEAPDDWYTTKSAVDLRVGGTFSSRMEAKDGSMETKGKLWIAYLMKREDQPGSGLPRGRSNSDTACCGALVAIGTKRTIAASQQFGRYWTSADIN